MAAGEARTLSLEREPLRMGGRLVEAPRKTLSSIRVAAALSFLVASFVALWAAHLPPRAHRGGVPASRRQAIGAAERRPDLLDVAPGEPSATSRGDPPKPHHEAVVVVRRPMEEPMKLGPQSLYCFSLMVAGSYEEKLIRAQRTEGISIFACEGWDVFSSEPMVLFERTSSDVVVKSIGLMNCSIGGPWDLALNTDVFLKAWGRIFEEGRFRSFGWTIKVDPDCVWFPTRFKRQVKFLDPSLEFYLNNCEEGLHGPIEVIPNGGMEVFAGGIGTCIENASLLKERDTWGEDVFLRHCFHILALFRINDFNLLSEEACFKEHPVKDGCLSGKVAFHPFKDSDMYTECMHQAQRSQVRTSFTESQRRLRAAPLLADRRRGLGAPPAPSPEPS